MPTSEDPHPPLEDCDNHSVGRADRQQVQDGGLRRDDDRSKRDGQQDEREHDDREDEPRHAFGDLRDEVNIGSGRTDDVGLGGHCRQDRVAQLAYQPRGRRILR
jgi:hypothetical protein